MYKVVKSAKIEVIKPSELKVGDYILWSNWKRMVLKINKYERTIVVSDPIGDREETLNFFMNYYKIIECEEIEIKDEIYDPVVENNLIFNE